MENTKKALDRHWCFWMPANNQSFAGSRLCVRPKAAAYRVAAASGRAIRDWRLRFAGDIVQPSTPMIRTFLLSLFLLASHALAQIPVVPKTVIVFGDSITAGSALPKEQQPRAWVRLVEAACAAQARLINEGKGGRPTASVAEFAGMLKRQPKADALIIALGMNDSRDITPQCVPKAVANVRAMIGKARQTYGATLPVLLVGPTNINQSALGPTKPIGDQREGKLRELGEAFARLAAETGCAFVSLFGVVPDETLLRDGVHPDAAGNAAIAKVMQGEVLKMCHLL